MKRGGIQMGYLTPSLFLSPYIVDVPLALWRTPPPTKSSFCVPHWILWQRRRRRLSICYLVTYVLDIPSIHPDARGKGVVFRVIVSFRLPNTCSLLLLRSFVWTAGQLGTCVLLVPHLGNGQTSVTFRKVHVTRGVTLPSCDTSSRCSVLALGNSMGYPFTSSVEGSRFETFQGWKFWSRSAKPRVGLLWAFYRATKFLGGKRVAYAGHVGAMSSDIVSLVVCRPLSFTLCLWSFIFFLLDDPMCKSDPGGA